MKILKLSILRSVVAIVIGLFFVLPTLAREEIRAFAADVTLHVDGSVRVVETVDINAEGIDVRRGIYRDIPTVMLDAEGRKLRSGFEAESVTRDGQPEVFRTERMGNFQRIWIGDPDQTLARQVHRYVITYTMTRMGRSFADHDELYWNATGNYWNFPILKSVARVTLPDGAVIQDLVGFTGIAGSTEKAVTITRTSDNEAVFRTSRVLAAGEGMSLAVSFQKGVLQGPQGMDALWQWLSDLRETILPIFGVILVLAYNFSAWRAVGRDPEKGTIIPLFYPPKDFSPALVHYVHNWGFAKGGWAAITASIFNLGVKGLVSIDNTAKKLTVAVTGKRPEEPLTGGEKVLFDYFTREGRVTIDQAAGPDLAKQREAFVSSIETENRTVWFQHNTGFVLLGGFLAVAMLAAMVLFDVLEIEWLVAAVIAGIVLAIAISAVRGLLRGNSIMRLIPLAWIGIVGFNIAASFVDFSTGLTINTAAIAAGSIVLVTVVFAVLMRAPTVQGRKVMDAIDGFKLYLETAEKNRLNIDSAPPMTVSRFERILPYAIALGVEKPWSQHFEGELARHAIADVDGATYHPRFYSGSSSFDSGRLSNSIAAATTGMAAAMVAAQPVQASSSGFSSSGGGGGGGSSGGGGGGGGGGGW